VTRPGTRDAWALRTGSAIAATLARELRGLVHDPVLGRVESAKDFAKHAVVEPLGISTFRKDRVGVVYEPKSDGMNRLVTAGLVRWGAPDVEAATVPAAASAEMADVVLGVAAVLADGLIEGPVHITTEGLARAAGIEPGALDDGGSPEVDLPLESTRAESANRTEFVARIVPPDGDGPFGHLRLVERFFGRVLLFADEPADDASAREAKQRRQVEMTLDRWPAVVASGGKMLVRLPFEIPGGAGNESMWVEVSDVNEKTISGTLIDEPLAATSVARGSKVSRARADIEAATVRSTE
jgi:hypothetical protein